jgi:hypothetical protein
MLAKGALFQRGLLVDFNRPINLGRDSDLGQACRGVLALRRAACFSSLNSVLLKCEKCNTKKDRRKAAGRG